MAVSVCLVITMSACGSRQDAQPLAGSPPPAGELTPTPDCVSDGPPLPSLNALVHGEDGTAYDTDAAIIGVVTGVG